MKGTRHNLGGARFEGAEWVGFRNGEFRAAKTLMLACCDKCSFVACVVVACIAVLKGQT